MRRSPTDKFLFKKDEFAHEIKFLKLKVSEDYESYEVIHDGRLHIIKAKKKSTLWENENTNKNYGLKVSEKP